VDSALCNASPIILLSRIDRLDILQAYTDKILVPDRVLAEIHAGEPHDPSVRRVAGLRGLAGVPDIAVPDRLAQWALDEGEAQVLAHALAGTAATVILDDRAARRVARIFSLPMIGTVGLVAWARTTGVIGQAEPVLEALCRQGMRASTRLIDEVLADLGERR
jgi:predicted nucleic acid-binding protein